MKRLALLLVAAVAACSDPSGPLSPLAGDYILMAQNGQQLPAPLHDASQTPLLTAGSLTIQEDGTFTMRRFYRPSADSVVREDITSYGRVSIHADGEIWFNFSGFEFSAEAERAGEAILLMGGEWYEGFLATHL